jgi:putative transposase
LVKDHTVIVPDLRGMGLSAHPDSGYTKKNQALDIAGVMDALQVKRADLVTHDIGNTFTDEAIPPIEAERFYRDLEPVLARAQRARHRNRSRAIHAKIANRRKDFLHNLSTGLVKAYGAIFVGNVNASALAKTRLAKSVLDAGWSTFRTMLLYKCADAGVWFDEVDEAFSTQTCSVCDSRAGPKGRKDLGIRGWQCTVCGAIHDRNVNAAHNILAAGHRRLAEGILVP